MRDYVWHIYICIMIMIIMLTYLPPGSGAFPAFTTAKTGDWFLYHILTHIQLTADDVCLLIESIDDVCVYK